MGKKKHFLTEEQKQYIIEHYPTEQTYIIAEKLGISVKKLQGFVYYKGLKKAEGFQVIRSDCPFTYEQADYLIENFSSKTNDILANELNCTTEDIARFARIHHLKKNDITLVKFSKISSENKRFILDNYATMLTSEISKITGVSCNNIRSYAYLHGIRRDKEKVPMMIDSENGLTIEQKRFIIDNYTNMTNYDIANKLGITLEQIHNYSSNRGLIKKEEYKYNKPYLIEKYLDEVKEENYNVRDYLGCEQEPRVNKDDLFISPYGKYYINQHYFDVIDNEWKAYWLGFLYADGCVTLFNKDKKTKNSVSISLKESDYLHLYKFANSLQTDSPIKIKNTNYKDYKCSKIIINNKQLCESLVRLGCCPNKSLNLFPPTDEQVPKEFLRDFVRGFFDGDGCIHINIENKTVRFNFTGTKEMLNFIKEVLIREIGASDISLKQKQNSKVYSLSYGNVFLTKKFYQYLYKNCNIYLDRKLEIFNTLFSLA